MFKKIISSTNANSPLYPLFQPSLPMSSWIQELHFPHLNIPITINKMFPVLPEFPIPSQTLYLSNLDSMIGSRVFTPTIYFYPSCGKNNTKPMVVQELRKSLSRVLVPYYPFAGRLREKDNGKLEVFFGQERGAFMVEAQAEMSLADLGDLTSPNPAWTPLIFRFPGEEPFQILNMPLLIAQVTLFRCGGFSIGLRLCHCLCDGLGAMQFIRAWAETTKAGKLVTDPVPCWYREFFKPRDPPSVKFPHVEFTRVDDHSSLTTSLSQGRLVQKCYKITNGFQSWLKNLAKTDNTSVFSTFDAMAAHIWRSWVKALDVKPLDYELRLSFSVNARHKLKNPPLQDGFYGNVLCVACATSKVSDLIHGRLSDTVQLVSEARQRMSEEYVRSTVDFIEVDMPRRVELGGKLTMTQWTRFSLYECADFGWGRPLYVGPIDLTVTPQVCVLLPQGDIGGSNGTMILCLSMPEFAADKFTKFLSFKDSKN